MALVVIDNAWETTTSTGPTTFTLAGAVSGSQSMAGVGNTNTSYFRISDQSGPNWTVVLAKYSTTGPTLTVVSTYASSNSNNAVTFGADTKNVWCVGPAESTVLAAPYAYPTVSPTLNLDFANSATVDPRITFVRNSTATYYDGKTTAMAEQNLLLQSNFATSNWNQYNGTLTNNVIVAPDGTTTASTWVQTSSTAQLYQPIVNSILVPYTFSVYVSVPSGTLPFRLRIGTTTPLYSSILTATTTWQRFTSTVTPTTAIASVVIDTDGTNFGTLNLAFAQLEQRSTVTAYTPTTTAAITNYIPVLMTAPAGAPRLDYNPTTGQALGLLIEEQRTNLLTYSQDFSNAAWTKGNSTITADLAIAPDGTTTADFILPNATLGSHSVSEAVAPASGVAYTVSAYFKAGGYNFSSLQITFGGLNAYCSYNLSTGALTGVAGGGGVGAITSAGNGWYRCSLTATTISTTGNPILLRAENDGTLGNWSGNGYSGIYIWGAQLE